MCNYFMLHHTAVKIFFRTDYIFDLSTSQFSLYLAIRNGNLSMQLTINSRSSGSNDYTHGR